MRIEILPRRILPPVMLPIHPPFGGAVGDEPFRFDLGFMVEGSRAGTSNGEERVHGAIG